ncbi:dehydrin DHN1-like [Juglans regia]|uniref:Dehydrin DHN1-like n=1 Tax=Juglans regia TaxID=51240 RepID=A0A6P9ELQ8_JUGRE|nr:dehydrin DHN1-like [Juglans regia]
MAHFQNKYGAAAHSIDTYGNIIRKDEYGNVIPTDEYGNPIRPGGTTLQGGQQQRHDLSTEYDGQGGRRNKGLTEKTTENVPGVGNNDNRNGRSSATTDAYGNIIRKDEYGNVIPTDEYGNPIRQSGTTLQGGQQQQQRHDVSTEYDGQGGRRNRGLKEKVTENIPGVGNKDHRNDTSSATTKTPTTTAGGYGTGEQAQYHQHAEKKGVMEKIKEKVRRFV